MIEEYMSGQDGAQKAWTRNQLRGVSVVVPVYRSTGVLRELYRRVAAVLGGVGGWEMILVDDGSPRETWEVVAQIAVTQPNVTGLRLSRNYGQHNALIAGVRAARYPVVVTIDDDLQNPPEEIPKLLAALDDSQDVVYGVPQRVAESMPRRWAGRISRWALSHGMGVSSAPDMSSFRAFRTKMRDAFTNDVGTDVSLDALLAWGSTRFTSVAVRHDPRSEGTSNYSYRRLLRFSIDTTTGYTTLPLQMASILGFAVALIGFGSLFWVLGRPLLTGQSVPGFPFLAAALAIFSGVQLLTLGIIGEYLARMHFRVMRKPTYVIRSVVGGSGADESS